MKATTLTWDALASDWNESLDEFASDFLGCARITDVPEQPLKFDELNLESNGDRAYVRVMYRHELYRKEREAKVRAAQQKYAQH